LVIWMDRAEKKAEVKVIQKQLKESVFVVLTDFRGLNVDELAELRKKLREKSADYRVVKNRLTKIAANNLDLSDLADYLTGPTALVMSEEEMISPAKVIYDFSKEHEALKIKGGILEGEIVDSAKIKALASLPPKEELLAKMMGGLNSPIAGFVNVLNGPLRGLVGALSAIADQKEKEEAA